MKTLDELEKEVLSEPFSGREFEQLTIDKVKKEIFKRTIKALSEIKTDGAKKYTIDYGIVAADYFEGKIDVVEHLPVAAQILQLKQENEKFRNFNGEDLYYLKEAKEHNEAHVLQLKAENKGLTNRLGEQASQLADALIESGQRHQRAEELEKNIKNCMNTIQQMWRWANIHKIDLWKNTLESRFSNEALSGKGEG